MWKKGLPRVKPRRPRLSTWRPSDFHQCLLTLLLSLSLSHTLYRLCHLSTAMNAIATASAVTLRIFCRASKLDAKRGLQGRFGVLAVFGVEKKNAWGAHFDVADPRSKALQYKGKFLDISQALEIARHDIQYCDWRAGPDVLTIMLLHEKVVEVLNPLAREYKSIGTMKKELAELHEELAQAHRHV